MTKSRCCSAEHTHQQYTAQGALLTSQQVMGWLASNIELRTFHQIYCRKSLWLQCTGLKVCIPTAPCVHAKLRQLHACHTGANTRAACSAVRMNHY